MKSNQNELKEGYEKLIKQCRDMAQLPIDAWLADLNHAETMGAIVDPTLYRRYIYSDKPKVLIKLMNAALEVKRAFEEVEPMLMRLFMEELEHAAQKTSEEGQR